MAYKISIPEPCQESWNAMPLNGADCRYCKVCDRTITDFTQKTDREILEYLQNGGKICGRFRQDQLDRPLIAQMRLRKSPWLGWAAGLWAAFATQEAVAQNAPAMEQSQRQTEENPESPVKDSVRWLSGVIRDEHQEPLIGVTVQFSDQNIGAASDVYGHFNLRIPITALHSEPFQLKVSYTGYSTIFVPLPNALRKADLCLPPVLMEQTSEEMWILGGPMVFAPKHPLKSRIRRFFKRITH